MSFRGRLTLFFVIIVIVPMVAIALLMLGLISQSEHGQDNREIAANQQVVANFFKDEHDRAMTALETVVRDRVFLGSLQEDDRRRASKRARQFVASRGIERIVFSGPRLELDVGGSKGVAAAKRAIRIRGSSELGTLAVSLIDAPGFARRMKALTGLDIVIRRGDSVLTSTLAGAAPGTVPKKSAKDVSIGGEDYVAGSFDDKKFANDGIEVATLAKAGGAGHNIRNKTLVALAILLGFLLAALACAVIVSKALQEQILELLRAARRVGAGDFSAEVPTVGHDEFAALGEEFNKMSRQLEERLEDLRREGIRVEGSMRRLGEAVASNLDRDALLALVVRTAVEGVGADAGRVSVRGADRVVLEELSRVGKMGGLEQAVQSVEAAALRSGLSQETTLGTASAIAHPLRARGDAGVVGVVSIARLARSFTPEECDLFHYLAGQASVSIENVDLHETVARESVTDELTGLSNRRGFDDALTVEIERSRRFGTKLGLVLLDLDDFKDINDTYGHPHGDLVLRAVARVLRDTSREIDYPARYGGEEMAVLLPETDVEGALRFAERLRERIDALQLPGSNGTDSVRVTASCGVASVPDSALDERGLVAAADAALYEAKRSGKNTSVPAR